MKKIAILQSNYIPWKGYFDIINSVDEFILYDDVQYTKNDWRNRNLIKTPNGLQWIAIPVYHNLSLKIKDVKVVNDIWRKKHWNSLLTNYSKALHFKDYKDQLEQHYTGSTEQYLSEINYLFIIAINKIFGITTKIKWSWDYKLEGDKSERLVNLCKQAHANVYVSGPSAKNYLQVEKFESEGIKICWMDYSVYPEYKQLYQPFEHNVSILDLVFNEGPNATNFIKSFRQHEK